MQKTRKRGKPHLEAKSVNVWAAFDPKTGECMLPTVRGWIAGAIGERDQFYKGCPIYQCLLSPLFPEEAIKPGIMRGAGQAGESNK